MQGDSRLILIASGLFVFRGWISQVPLFVLRRLNHLVFAIVLGHFVGVQWMLGDQVLVYV
jgi:hypothetical protein